MTQTNLIIINDGERTSNIRVHQGCYAYRDLQGFCSTSKDFDVLGGKNRRTNMWDRDMVKYMICEGKEQLFVTHAGIRHIVSTSSNKSLRKKRLELFLEHADAHRKATR